MRLLLSVTLVAALAQAPATDRVPADDGDIHITALGHASLQLEHGGRVIVIDPASAQADLAPAKPADLILVTDIHGDHLDPEGIAKVRQEGAPVVIPEAARDRVPDGTVMANNETREVAGVTIEAIPMYNLERGPEPGRLYHDKGRGNGYVLTLGGKRVYVAGDTECVPEIRELQNIDVAFLPMNLPFTMTPAEAAECAKAFQPGIVYPYHHRGQDPQEFVAALEGEPIEVRVLNWYQAAASGN